MRLQTLTAGTTKGLLSLDARTTILSNLLNACDAVSLNPVLTVNPNDHIVRERTPGRQHTSAWPKGYINDIASVSVDLDDAIFIDCDTVALPVDLRASLLWLMRSECDFSLTLSRTPYSDDPRSIRPITRDGRLIDLSFDPHIPRTAGIYRFKGRALHDIKVFAASGAGTFHDFFDFSASLSRPTALHVIDTAYNVNWPNDLMAARGWWRLSVADETKRSAVKSQGGR
jgi:hypothetical protein